MPDRLLIVDNDATDRINLKTKLTAACYEVALAPGPAAARIALAEGKTRLLILSDRIDGPGGARRFCRSLAGDPARADLPIIVVGSRPSQKARLKFLAAGAADYLARPLDDAALLARVRSLLRDLPRELPVDVESLAIEAHVALRPQPPGLIGIVNTDRTAALRWKAALDGRIRDRIAIYRPETLFDRLRQEPKPDIFVIGAEQARLTDLRLIAELRVRQDTRSSPVLVVGGGQEPEFDIMALDLGAGDVLSGGFDADELVLRLRARLRQKRAGERRRRTLAEGLRLAATDGLTGLLNRRATFARLAAMARDAKLRNRPYGLMILDIDRFKRINDTHGHAGGDIVLCEVARRLTRNMRDGDLLGRIGGEEFLVALPDCALAPARKAAERLRRIIEARPVTLQSGVRVYVTLSVGLCLCSGTEETVGAAYDRADRALYVAKAGGRNTVTVGRPAA
ncbi:diguanylate cyclase domain-containing protein [Frigidibacter sp. ROC022]|uniref:diguanylate cyclase domain-containing protein n=1 Tax=Frigidibacter sp. ROC022 TaxID=2971796 RepID=UPI00215B2B20|nr:diguanylate cyclase [Frigidibacter sp. ROC022]MCR8725451.1 diguanylate cyclase [Frigidibacter sp. ROC022]